MIDNQLNVKYLHNMSQKLLESNRMLAGFLSLQKKKLSRIDINSSRVFKSIELGNNVSLILESIRSSLLEDHQSNVVAA